MSERIEEVKRLCQEALDDPKKLQELVDDIMGTSRRRRQMSAAALSYVAKEQPKLLIEHIPAFVDALNRPEAQTRWECLDVLTVMVEHDARACEKALPGAEAALFDEDSGPVRLSAMRFLCKFGSTTAARSERCSRSSASTMSSWRRACPRRLHRRETGPTRSPKPLPCAEAGESSR